MAMEKAVIASDIGGHRELVKHDTTGILFPAGDANALAKAITSLINDKAKMNSLGKAGRSYVLANKTWEKTTSVYKQIYEKIKIC
jgi:glycosyltransferase involved in cell wall biosynthesis